MKSDPVWQNDFKPNFVKFSLSNSHFVRARVNDRLKRYSKAIEDWDRAIEIGAAEEKLSRRFLRALTNLNAGFADKVTPELTALIAMIEDGSQLTKLSPTQIYDCACVFGIACRTDRAKKDVYAEHGMKLLRRAATEGYRNIDHMKVDPDLDSFRDRQEFQQFIEDLEKDQRKQMPNK